MLLGEVYTNGKNRIKSAKQGQASAAAFYLNRHITNKVLFNIKDVFTFPPDECERGERESERERENEK